MCPNPPPSLPPDSARGSRRSASPPTARSPTSSAGRSASSACGASAPPSPGGICCACSSRTSTQATRPTGRSGKPQTPSASSGVNSAPPELPGPATFLSPRAGRAVRPTPSTSCTGSCACATTRPAPSRPTPAGRSATCGTWAAGAPRCPRPPTRRPTSATWRRARTCRPPPEPGFQRPALPAPSCLR